MRVFVIGANNKNSHNLVQQAIALLVHYPEIASTISDPDIFSSADTDEFKLLHKLLNLLHQSPSYTPARLMGHWHGTADGETINHIANQEHPLLAAEVDITNIRQQFIDTLEKLQRQKEDVILESHVDKLRARNYAELSESDKLQLREYLQRNQ